MPLGVLLYWSAIDLALGPDWGKEPQAVSAHKVAKAINLVQGGVCGWETKNGVVIVVFVT